MGLFDKKTKEQIIDEKREYYSQYMVEGEELLNIYQTIIDFVVVTSKKIIVIDNSLWKAKTNMIFIPFDKISAISMEYGAKKYAKREFKLFFGAHTIDITMFNHENEPMEFFQYVNNQITK